MGVIHHSECTPSTSSLIVSSACSEDSSGEVIICIFQWYWVVLGCGVSLHVSEVFSQSLCCHWCYHLGANNYIVATWSYGIFYLWNMCYNVNSRNGLCWSCDISWVYALRSWLLKHLMWGLFKGWILYKSEGSIVIVDFILLLESCSTYKIL